MVLLHGACWPRWIAPYPPDLTNNAAFLKPPAWQERRLTRLLAGHRCHRPRHSLAPDARRTPRRWSIGIAVVALVGGGGHRAGPGCGLCSKACLEIAIDADDGHHPRRCPACCWPVVIVAILGPGLMNAMLAVAIVVLPHYVRITRAAVIAETSRDYVTAARMDRCRPSRA